jgi:hypothetical protein
LTVVPHVLNSNPDERSAPAKIAPLASVREESLSVAEIERPELLELAVDASMSNTTTREVSKPVVPQSRTRVISFVIVFMLLPSILFLAFYYFQSDTASGSSGALVRWGQSGAESIFAFFGAFTS